MAEVITSDGVTLHYEVAGRDDGPPLVFSNSLGTNLHMWDRQADAAASLGLRVVRYDQRGHGRSAAPAGDYALSRLADDVIDLLDALSIETALFCGLSMGAMTGLHLGKRHPPRFTRFALCNMAAWMPPPAMWNERIASVREHGMEGVVDGILARWFTPAWREANAAEVARVRAMILATPPAGYAGCCSAIRDMDERNQLGVIEAPVLVVIGAHDVATLPARGQHVVERIPGAQKAVLETGHLSNIEQPDAFNRAVLGFLTGVQT